MPANEATTLQHVHSYIHICIYHARAPGSHGLVCLRPPQKEQEGASASAWLRTGQHCTAAWALACHKEAQHLVCPRSRIWHGSSSQSLAGGHVHFAEMPWFDDMVLLMHLDFICRKALQLLRYVLIENPDDARAACNQGLPELVAELANTADNDVRLVALLLASQLILDAGAAQKFEKVNLPHASVTRDCTSRRPNPS